MLHLMRAITSFNSFITYGYETTTNEICSLKHLLITIPSTTRILLKDVENYFNAWGLKIMSQKQKLCYLKKEGQESLSIKYIQYLS